MSAVPRLGVRHFEHWRQNWYSRLIQQSYDLAIRQACGLPGGIGGVQITMPPQHGKSTQVVEGGPSYGFSRHPDLKVMLQTYGRDFSARAVQAVSGILSDPAHMAFSPARVGRAKSYDIDPVSGRLVETSVATEARANMMRLMRAEPGGRVTKARGYFLATTPKAASTGWGFDLGLLDDLIKNQAEAINPAIRAFLENAIKTAFFTRRSPHSAIVQVLTRWHALDIGHVLPELWRKAGIPYISIELPAIAHAEGPARPYDPRKPGEPLDTARYGLKWYEEQQALLDDPDHWDALYQQRPKITTGASFDDHQWLRYDPADLGSGGRIQRIALSIDTNNGTTGPKNDPTQIDVCALVLDPKTRKLEAWKLGEERGRWETPETLVRVLGLIQKWKPTDVLIEQGAAGRSLLDFLKRDLGDAREVLEVGKIDGRPYPIQVCRGGAVKLHAIPHHGMPKAVRVELASPYIATRVCRLPGRDHGAVTAGWVPDHLKEWRDWPMGAHDDRLDSWGQFVRWAGGSHGLRPDYGALFDSGALRPDEF